MAELQDLEPAEYVEAAAAVAETRMELVAMVLEETSVSASETAEVALREGLREVSNSLEPRFVMRKEGGKIRGRRRALCRCSLPRVNLERLIDVYRFNVLLIVCLRAVAESFATVLNFERRQRVVIIRNERECTRRKVQV